MSGAIHPLPQYTFMGWCSVKKNAQGQLYFTFTSLNKLIQCSDQKPTKFLRLNNLRKCKQEVNFKHTENKNDFSLILYFCESWS
jgi:virulence-associated protein VapD